VAEPFGVDPGFVEAQAELARPRLAELRPGHVVLSYHGVPERQLQRSDPGRAHCLARPDCCEAEQAPARCYRAACFATSRALARALDLAPGAHTTAFQSRFGLARWTLPHTDRTLDALAARGVRRVAVLCPSFAVDCLETLEEIGIRARERFLARGGEALTLVPCASASERFADAVSGWIRGGTERPAR
jgi:ferrochelatase